MNRYDCRVGNLFLLLLMSALYSCHSTEQWGDDVYGNFDALWSILDQHYCNFEEKGVDWERVGEEYREKLRPDMTQQQLFAVMSEMLDCLRDGHTNLAAPFDVSYYRKWWSDYPQNFDKRLIEQYYLDFNWHTASGLKYGVLSNNIGYIRYESFSSAVGSGNLDYVLYNLRECVGLIIDVRDNGGGDLTNVETLVSRFTPNRMLGGYIVHKSGPGHEEFSEPYPYYIDPAPDGYQMWGKPVAVVVNRSTYSAANNFVSIMKELAQVKIVGAQSGGGGAMPFTSMLPNGWVIRFSGSPMLNCKMESIEDGVSPTPGCEVDLDREKALIGIDTMIERASAILLDSYK